MRWTWPGRLTRTLRCIWRVSAARGAFTGIAALHFHSTPLHSIPLTTPLHHSTPLHSTPLHSTPLHPTPLHSTPLRSTPLHSTPLHSTLLHSTPLHSTPLHSTPCEAAGQGQGQGQGQGVALSGFFVSYGFVPGGLSQRIRSKWVRPRRVGARSLCPLLNGFVPAGFVPRVVSGGFARTFFAVRAGSALLQSTEYITI